MKVKAAEGCVQSIDGSGFTAEIIPLDDDSTFWADFDLSVLPDDERDKVEVGSILDVDMSDDGAVSIHLRDLGTWKAEELAAIKENARVVAERYRALFD